MFIEINSKLYIMDKNNNFDELEREIQNYKEMSTSINRIKNSENESDKEFEREPFSDANLNKKENCYTKECALNKESFSVDNFVKDLESNLDNFDNIQPANTSFVNEKPKKKKIEQVENTVVEKVVEPMEPSTNWKELIYNFLVEVKEPIIIVILFILANNSDFIKVVAKIPYINRLNSIYPSLIIRGLIVAIMIYLLRKNSKN
jgi:hypothetical protein